MNNILNTCLAKVPRTKKSAEATVLRLRGKKFDRLKDGTLQAYHCKNCTYWHVGHMREVA